MNYRPLPCTLTNLGLFDSLRDCGAVTDSGYIRKCFEEMVDDVPVQDEFRKALLVEDSENYGLFDDEQREELLFRLMKHLAVGGSLCQFEDTLPPYLDALRQIYRGLLSVRKTDSGRVEVASVALEITGLEFEKDGGGQRMKEGDAVAAPRAVGAPCSSSVARSMGLGGTEGDDPALEASERPAPAPVLSSMEHRAVPAAAITRKPASTLFPNASPYNLCFVTIDPIQRWVTYYYFAYLPLW